MEKFSNGWQPKRFQPVTLWHLVLHRSKKRPTVNPKRSSRAAAHVFLSVAFCSQLFALQKSYKLNQVKQVTNQNDAHEVHGVERGDWHVHVDVHVFWLHVDRQVDDPMSHP